MSRLSAFNLYVDGYPTADDTLVHNTFSDAFVVLDRNTVAVLRKADRGESLTDDELQLAQDPDLCDPDVGVVVTSRDQEAAEFRRWFEWRRTRSTVMDVLVSVNLACNFACSYCSQAGVLDGSVMSEADADATADWVVEHARSAGLASVTLTFCGGEPLLHPGRIEQIARRVTAAGVELAFNVITNGYFLDEPMLDRLIPLGLVRAQVTLDGDESTHSQTRISKAGEDTFSRIFDQVIAASKRIQVAVNGNYTEQTSHGFGPLLRKLAAAGLPAGTRVSFSPALEGLNAPDGSATGCSWGGSDTSQQVALHDQITRLGFATGAPANVVGPCELHDRHSFAVDPDGSIYACPGFMAHPEWSIGHVRDGLTARYEQILAVNAQRECGGCSHQPNCGGGCIASQWLRVGRMEGVNCELGYFERVSRDAIIREYLVATCDSPAQALQQHLLFHENSTLLPEQRGRRVAALRIVAA